MGDQQQHLNGTPVNGRGPAAPPARARLSPTQTRVFNELLAIGAERPTARPALADHIRQRIDTAVADHVRRWDGTLWISKSQIETTVRCEGNLVATKDQTFDGPLPVPTAIGTVTHKAVQLAHTHPGATMERYVKLAVAAALTDPKFNDFWGSAPDHIQSDVIVAAVSRLAGFTDAFPPLNPVWLPRFEERLRVKIGSLTLGARPDLMLGRPRADGRQTMLICDLKSGDLHDYHYHEAQFYALIALLRHEVPPFRSTVFSLLTGEWTDPDVTEESLLAAADRLITVVPRYVAVLTGRDTPTLTGGVWCRWCPAAATCPAADPDEKVATRPPPLPPPAPSPAAAEESGAAEDPWRLD